VVHRQRAPRAGEVDKQPSTLAEQGRLGRLEPGEALLSSRPQSAWRPAMDTRETTFDDFKAKWLAAGFDAVLDRT
jgi:hypothetical protein